jgi:hypothetical protein
METVERRSDRMATPNGHKNGRHREAARLGGVSVHVEGVEVDTDQ